MSRQRVLALAISPLAVGALAFATAAPATAAAGATTSSTAAATNGLTTAVTGTIGGVSKSGTFSITRFVQSGSQILAVGNLALGGINLGTASVPVNLANTAGSCPILHLDLGPLDLNLLGLVVHLNEVVLDITAQSGSGDLLGNLLCAVANLLNGGGSLTTLTDLLNQILGAL